MESNNDNLPPTHDARMFTWGTSSLKSSGIAEASDFGTKRIHGGDFVMMIRGRQSTLRFVLSDTRRNEKGELISYIYRTSDHKFEVMIIND